MTDEIQFPAKEDKGCHQVIQGLVPMADGDGFVDEAVHHAQTGRSADAEQLAVLPAGRRPVCRWRGAGPRGPAVAVGRAVAVAQPGCGRAAQLVDAPQWADAALRRVSAGRPGIVALVVASFHPSGHVREAAVARLAEMDDQLAVPALALRAADWVPLVRSRARLALEQRLSPPSADVLLAVGPLAVALRERDYGRRLLGQFQQAFMRYPMTYWLRCLPRRSGGFGAPLTRLLWRTAA